MDVGEEKADENDVDVLSSDIVSAASPREHNCPQSLSLDGQDGPPRPSSLRTMPANRDNSN